MFFGEITHCTDGFPLQGGMGYGRSSLLGTNLVNQKTVGILGVWVMGG